MGMRDVRVEHRRFQICVPEEGLDSTNVRPRLKQVCGERVAKPMDCRMGQVWHRSCSVAKRLLQAGR